MNHLSELIQLLFYIDSNKQLIEDHAHTRHYIEIIHDGNEVM